MRLPAFIDSHLHFLGLGYIQSNVDLAKTGSIEAIKAALKASKNKDIIIGRGFNQEKLVEKRLPTKADLNAVSLDIPVVIIRICGHVIVVNDKMLEIAGIKNSTPQIEGGTFDAETGLFTEKAIYLIYDHFPKPDCETLKSYLLKANEICLANGITSVATDDFSTLSVDYELIIKAYRELNEKDLLKVRVVQQVNLSLEKFRDFLKKGYANRTFGRLRMGPLKILADGSLGAKTAYLNAPYEGEPNNRGVKTFSDAELFELINLADRNGMDSVIHAIGDGAIDQAISAIEKSIEMTGRTKHQHAIIHAQMLTKSQIERMRKHRIGAIIQPIFLNSDIPIIANRIGVRSSDSYLFHSLYLSGLPTGFSTDAPVETVNPFHNLYAAITRTSIDFPDLPAFNINEAYTLEEALQAYTSNNLPFVYQKHLPRNDYIIVDRDIYHIDKNDLKDTIVKATYVDNELVYQRKYQG